VAIHLKTLNLLKKYYLLIADLISSVAIVFSLFLIYYSSILGFAQILIFRYTLCKIILCFIKIKKIEI
jgi:hypothetical protein